MNKNVAILGCGWLGFPLAVHLINKGYTVNGSTTSKEKMIAMEAANIRPFYVKLSENGLDGNIIGLLENVTILVINVPPRLRSGSGENYVAKMNFLLQAINKSTINKVIFASSTSVYGNISGDVTENTVPRPSSASGRQLLESERLLNDQSNFNCTIIRFGGLIGADRHPVTMLSGRKNLKNGHHPVNLVQQKDCIQIIENIITHGWWNELFNAVYPHHPSKKEYYSEKAEELNIQKPEYETNKEEIGKTVHSERLENVKGYRFTTTL